MLTRFRQYRYSRRPEPQMAEEEQSSELRCPSACANRLAADERDGKNDLPTWRTIYIVVIFCKRKELHTWRHRCGDEYHLGY